MSRPILIIALLLSILASFTAGWHLRHIVAPLSAKQLIHEPPDAATRTIPGIIGSIDAPVSLRAFLSFSSPESANFILNVLPAMQKGPVADGRLQVIIHDTPEDRNALHASILSRCASATAYPQVVETLFKTRNTWTTSEDPALELARIALSSGLSETRLTACLSTTNGVRFVSKLRDSAYDEYRIKSAPSFLFSRGEKIFWLEGTPSAREFMNAFTRMDP